MIDSQVLIKLYLEKYLEREWILGVPTNFELRALTPP